jgi:hypothetical protein
MTITKDEKISIIAQRVRSIEFNKYNLQLALLEENALVSPKADTVSDLTEQIAQADRKLEALDEELDTVNS